MSLKPLALGAAITLAFTIACAKIIPRGASATAAAERLALVESGALKAVGSDGSELATIVPQYAAFTYRDPAWSPDGTHIAFARLDSGDWNVFTVRSDGSDLIRLADLYLEDAEQPHWSPDGAQVLFTCSGQPLGYEGTDLCRINADGTGRVDLTPTNNIYESN